MRCLGVMVCNTVLLVAPLTAQDNPFAFTGGSVKSAHIVYNITSANKGAAAGASWEIGVAPDRWIMKTIMPFELAGKKDTMRMLMVTTRDSQYTYTVMGKEREGKVSPQLRPHLAREYAALNAAGKARFKENVKLLTNSGSSGMGSSSDANSLITLTGQKMGSETIGGHKCDVYKREEVTACVVPGAPLVALRWSDAEQGLSMVAKTIKLNTPLPPALAVLPKGVQWKKEPHDDADFIMGVWSLKHPEKDPEQVPGASLAKFAVGYLASAGATAELREMSAGTESGSSEDMPEDDGSSEEDADTSGS
jgi:hypothetical protein